MEAIKDVHLQGVARLLVHDNLLNRDQALHYQHLALSNHVSFIHYLVTHAIMDAQSIALSIAAHFAVTFLDLDSIDVASIPALFINEKLLRQHRVVPLFSRDNQVYVATDDPSLQEALSAVQFHIGQNVIPLVVETHKLSHLIDHLLQQHEHQGLTDYFAIADDDGRHTLTSDDDAPVVKFVNRILLEAVELGVSDVHFEPYADCYRIRYRHDGLLNEVATPPINLAMRIASRIKVMSNLDISERRVPQDGRFSLKNKSGSTVDCRISTCPTLAGEKIVVRLLRTGLSTPDMDTLDFSPLQKTQFLNAIQRPQGMILVTGPTGSGKTTTLYAALNRLNLVEKNISTAEDPVEINVPGINQVNINPKVCLTFAHTLRSFLRQDPDVIMIGEIRDLDTAETAIKAAQTGHLVLSTLHTNSAAETITRLINMGVAAFDIASAVSLIIAQRLVRRLCDQCKLRRTDLTPQAFIELGFSALDAETMPSYQACGCNQCTHGYRGRIAVFEVMPMSKHVSQCIVSGNSAQVILNEAQREGMVTLYQAGLLQVIAGVTSIEEVHRVIGHAV